MGLMSLEDLCIKYPEKTLDSWLEAMIEPNVSESEDLDGTNNACYIAATREDNLRVERTVFIKIPKAALTDMLLAVKIGEFEGLVLDILHPVYYIESGVFAFTSSYSECREYQTKNGAYTYNIPDKEDFLYRTTHHQHRFYDVDDPLKPSWYHLVQEPLMMSSIEITTKKIFVNTSFAPLQRLNTRSAEEILYTIYPALDPKSKKYNEKLVLQLNGNKALVDEDGKCNSYGKEFKAWAATQSHDQTDNMITTLSQASSPN